MKTHISGLITLTIFSLLVSCQPKEVKTASDNAFTFAFLTDIHVEYNKNADKGMQAVVAHVNAKAPDFVLTGGDLVSDALGQTEETATMLYDLYIELEKGFDMPVYNAIGNHEEFGIYEKSGISPDHPLYKDGMFEAKIGKRFYTVDHKGWRFYILDSVDETEDRKYFGNIDSVQLAWIEEDLKNVDPKTPLTIVTHIPFITTTAQIREGALAQNSPGLAVGNSNAVLDLFADHNLKLVLQGHLHHLEDVYIQDIHFLTGGAVCARWWEGPRDGLEEGYVLVHVNGEDFTWEYVDYGWEVE